MRGADNVCVRRWWFNLNPCIISPKASFMMFAFVCTRSLRAPLQMIGCRASQPRAAYAKRAAYFRFINTNRNQHITLYYKLELAVVYILRRRHNTVENRCARTTRMCSRHHTVEHARRTNMQTLAPTYRAHHFSYARDRRRRCRRRRPSSPRRLVLKSKNTIYKKMRRVKFYKT